MYSTLISSVIYEDGYDPSYDIVYDESFFVGISLADSEYLDEIIEHDEEEEEDLPWFELPGHEQFIEENFAAA